MMETWLVSDIQALLKSTFAKRKYSFSAFIIWITIYLIPLFSASIIGMYLATFAMPASFSIIAWHICKLQMKTVADLFHKILVLETLGP